MWTRFSLFAVVANANPSWEAWKAAHGRNYLTAQEEAFRQSVFTKNMATAATQNELNPLATFGADEWSDWTEEEFSALRGYVPHEVNIPEAPKMNVTDLATDKDWTGTATTPVKNQGSCGSCWAFSAVEQVESDYILQHQKTVKLACQELVDCTGSKGRRNGCNGGMPSSAYNVIKSLGGMEAEADYRYTAQNGNCQFQKSKVKVKVTSYQSVGRGSETEMKKVDHCVQLVGYGVEGSTEYWKVRNSWNTNFGEAGFIRIKIGSNLCQINSGPTKVTAEPLGGVVV